MNLTGPKSRILLWTLIIIPVTIYNIINGFPLFIGIPILIVGFIIMCVDIQYLRKQPKQNKIDNYS